MHERVIGGRYRLGKPLGAGGMGEVFAAEDLELERPVAVKLLGRDADRARFEREARAAASLAHPNVNLLYDYGEVEGRPYMVLEYLPGGSLADRLTPGRPLPDDETRRIAAEVAQGLAHAHSRGLVHRDLKPANILFDADGRAKIADFGIARLADSGTLTEAGTLLGSAAYISPEQAAGLPATPASDVYSFAVMLFQMLTGRLPFEHENPMALVKMHRDQPAPPLSRFRKDAPPDLESLAAAALAKDPADRPADGAALAAELGAAAPAAAETATLVIPRRAGPRRRRRLGALVTAALVLGGAGAAVAVIATETGARRAPAAPSTVTPTSRSSSTTTAASTTVPPPVTTISTTSSTTSTTRRTTTRPTSTTTTSTTTAPPTTTIPPPPPPTTTPTVPPATTVPP